MYRLNALSTKCLKSLPLVMASICGHYMYEHIRHNDTITTKSDPNFTIKPLKTLRNAHLVDTDVAVKMKEIYDQTLESLVVVSTTGGCGTGFIVDPSGLIVTNCHVVENFQKATVNLWVGRPPIELFDNDPSIDPIQELAAQVVYADPTLDLALVRVFVVADALPELTLSTREDIEAGEPVLVFGSPGFSTGTALGVIIDPQHPHPVNSNSVEFPDSNLHMSDTARYVEHSAPTTQGYSGGPVVNGDGAVIGVHFAGNQKGFAIKATDANEFVINGKLHERLAARQEYAIAGKKSLGVVLTSVNGFRVTKVGINRWANVPEQNRRLLVDDVITHIDGKPLESVNQLKESLKRLTAGHPLPMSVMRNEGPLDIWVKPLIIDYHNCSAL